MGIRSAITAGLALIYMLLWPWTGQAGAETLILLGNQAVPPKAYLDKGGAPRGFAVDAAVTAIHRAGFDVEVRLYPFQRALELARQGYPYLATGIFRTPEREEIYDYSVPLVDDLVLLVTLKGKEFTFEEFEDLKGKRIAYQQGARYGADFEAILPDLTTETDNDPVGRLRKLAGGRVDAIVVNPGRAALVASCLKAGMMVEDFSILPRPVASLPNHLIIAKRPGTENAEILRRIDKAIGELRSEGVLDAIMSAY